VTEGTKPGYPSNRHKPERIPRFSGIGIYVIVASEMYSGTIESVIE
jgi:hypothetical protein